MEAEAEIGIRHNKIENFYHIRVWLFEYRSVREFALYLKNTFYEQEYKNRSALFYSCFKHVRYANILFVFINIFKFIVFLTYTNLLII